MLSIITYNILNGFNDPFEFEGEYKYDRTKIFKIMTNSQLLLKQIITKEHIEKFIYYASINKNNEFTETKIRYFFNCLNYDQVTYEYIKNHKIILDKYLIHFNLSILGSKTELNYSMKCNEFSNKLIDELFETDVLNYIINIINDKCPNDFYIKHIILYWIYQSIYLKEIEINLINREVNKIKKWFCESIGSIPDKSLKIFNEVINNNCDILFTQEANTNLQYILTCNDFMNIDKQDNSDGTLIFLRKKSWKEFKTIYNTEKLNIILAINNNNDNYILCSCHGKSTDYKDSIEKMNIINNIYKNQLKINKNIYLIIGIDANTKDKNECIDFSNKINELDLQIMNNVDIPTTIKKRILSTQYNKRNKPFKICEDYIITSKNIPYKKHEVFVGFDKSINKNSNEFIPNYSNPSDHFPVLLNFYF